MKELQELMALHKAHLVTVRCFDAVKRSFLPILSQILVRVGLSRTLLYFAHRLTVKRGKINQPVFPFVKRRKHSNFQILFYHRVNNEQDPFFCGVPVEIFYKQMEILSKYFNVMPLDELIKRVEKNDVPPNSVSITFDDGYRDNYENAFPILKQFDLPATIYLTTRGMDSRNVLWHDQIFDAFRRTQANSVVIEGKDFRLGTISEKRIALYIFLENIRSCNPRDRNILIKELLNKLNIEENLSGNELMLSWDEIDQMANEKITFGAHTVSHPILTRMPLADAIDEIITSKQVIEKKLKTPVRLFAYPNGGRNDFNETLKHTLKEAGFLCAVTTLWGANDIHTDPFELRRMRSWDRNRNVFLVRLGWYKFSS